MKFHNWIWYLCTGLFFFICPIIWANDYDLVSQEVLQQAGLQSNWQIQLPLKSTEQISNLYIFDKYLYALTDTNIFFCIERDKGSVRSLQTLAVAGLPILPPIHFENRSVFLIGQEIKVFDPNVGRIIDTVKLPQLDGSSEGIARNTDTFYVCGSDNRLYAFSAKDGTRLTTVTADNDSPIRSVIASDRTVWFSTTVGNIVAMDTWTRQKRWQYNLTGKMKAPLLLEDGYLYAAGLDTKLYKIDSKRGNLVWKEPFVSGGLIQERLVLGKACVYVFTENTGLYAVNKETGKAVWNLPQGRSVLSELGDQSYVYVQPAVLKLMNNSNGKEQLSVDIAGVDQYAVNTTDSVLYMADKWGRIMAAQRIPERKIGIARP